MRLLDTAFQRKKRDKVDNYIHYLSYLQKAAEGPLKCEIFDKRTKYLLKVKTTVSDGSAIITGILLAYNVPSNLPWWISNKYELSIWNHNGSGSQLGRSWLEY